MTVATIALAPAAAHAASSVRIVRPANGELVNGRRMLVVVRVPSGASRVRVSVDGRDVSRRLHARSGTRVGTVTGVAPGAVHIVVSAGVRSQQRLAFANVFAQGRRDRRMIVLLNANATLLRHAANQGVARLAIRTPSNAIVRATLNGHAVGVPVDFRTGNRLAVFNRADGLRRGRNTLRLLAFTRGGRYDRLTRSATIPRSAPMAVAGPDRQLVAGQTLHLNGGRSVAAQPGIGLSYSWRVVGKPAGTSPRLRSAARARAKLRLGKPGRYTLALTVTEQGPNGIRRRSTDLLLATVAPPAPPTGAPIETMAQQNGQTGILIGTSKPQFSAGPPDGQVGVYGFDPKTLQTDPDRNVLIPDNGDVDSKLKDAVGQFTAGTIVVVTGRDCCGASSKLLPKSGAFSYITSYDGNKDHFGQSGTWNRNLKLTEDNGGTSAAGELNGVLRYQPSDDGTFRYVQDGSVSYSTSAPTESTLYPADGATYRILDSDGDAVDNEGAGGVGSQLSASRPASALGQQWELQRAYGDYYRIVNSASGMCMNLSGNDAKTVLQWPCTGANAANEVWFVRARSDGDEQYFTLEPASQPPGAKTVVASLGAGGMTVVPLDDGDKTQRFTFGLAPGVYTISDASTGNLVGEPDFDAAWGTRLAVGPASGHSTQQWRVVDGPSGSFKLVNVASGLCMDVTGASADAGTPIERYACDPNAENQPNELWSAVGQADGIALVSKNSGMVLSRQQGGLIQRADNNDKGQRWRLNRVSAPVTTGGDYAIEATSANGWGERRALDATAAGPALTSLSDAGTQQWRLTDAGNGLVELYSLGTGKCLTPGSGGVVSLSPCDPSSTGIWRVDRRTDGTYALTDTGPGGGVLTAGTGTQLSVATDSGASSQNWMLGGRPVTMELGEQRSGTAIPFGAAGFVVTAFDASRRPITGDGGILQSPTWPAAYVTNGTLASQGESLGLLLQALANQAGTTVMIQSIGRPKPGPGWAAIAAGIEQLGGDPSEFGQLDGSGDYAFVGCAGCTDATQFDEAARRASDPGLIGARLQGSLARNESSTYAADAGAGVAIDSSLGELVARPSSPWPFDDGKDGSTALNYIASALNLGATCNDSAQLDPVRNSYCLQNVNASTPWPDRAIALDKLDPPSGVDPATWAQVKAQLHTEWTNLDNIRSTFQSLSTVYSSVASGSAAQGAANSISQLIRDDLNQPPPPRDVVGDVLSVISDTMQLVGSVGPLVIGEEAGAPGPIAPLHGHAASNAAPAADPEPEPEPGASSEALLGLLQEAWTLAGTDDGSTDAAGNTIQTQATNYATSLDEKLSDLADDLPVVENALVSDPIRLEVAGNNAEQDWTLPQDTYSDLKNDLKAGLARNLWTTLLPAAYDVYQFPKLPSDATIQGMRCNGHQTFAQQPAAAAFSQPSSFDASGNTTAAVTMTLSPKTVKDDLELPRHVGSNVLNALFGAPAPGSANGGFSTRELIGETGINVRDQTAKQPEGNTPIFPCFVYSQDNKHSWDYDAKSKSWQQAR